MNHLGLASVNDISRFLNGIKYKEECCRQLFFIFELSHTTFEELNLMKIPVTTEERSRKWKTL